ncbi:hypothetical protein IMG5_101410 [Ichthyophthirius multifiliis]|uniref:Uncharacterized protein n=1 Tax=Ichthyophthirius multifiliis TaxID=5932 RepID=G0QSI9_ICHMU|nr:hypothetical protein IMG5_101410 [Ichthyophthirius multifiliis]EGR31827.1 hypothetical protein IMG5_101410 [Ichthyophthirius multifiliis]|eukprot:XP_004035313.1 hypothetical protein IMG5_101410 [Ichthyophthirius multifiliis]
MELIKQEIDKQQKQTKEVDLIDFIYILLTNLEHKQEETFYYIISIIDLFKKITETSKSSFTHINFNQLTDYICEVKIYIYLVTTTKIKKNICPQKKYNNNSKIRKIDINPPLIYGKTEEGIKRLNLNSLKADSYRHNNNSITKGVYVQDIQRILILDYLCSYISLYKLNMKYDHNVPIKQNKENDIILYFAYSQIEQRIGACLQNLCLQFWDCRGDYKFSKIFDIHKLVNVVQNKIFYIESFKIWITTDSLYHINVWNIEKEVLSFQLNNNKKVIEGEIIDIIDIIHLKLIGVASLDKKISIWDFNKQIQVQIISLDNSGIHHLVYFYSFQVLLSCGFGNNILVHKINPIYFDHDIQGNLIGHQSVVTAVQVIEKSPMIVSGDYLGYVKIWDLRSLKCIQSVNLGEKSIIQDIIYIEQENMICIVGNRLNFIYFDYGIKQQQQENCVFPIKVEVNLEKEEILVCTRKDLRFFCLNSGKLKYQFNGLLDNQDDEISCFQSFEQYQKFALSDQKGNIQIHSFINGKKEKSLIGCVVEISGLKFDFLNKLFISSSFDGKIFIQNENEFKRQILNVFYKKEIHLLEISVYHNLIVVCNFHNNNIYIFNYEYCKLVSCIQVEGSPSSLQFINRFEILIISTSNGKIYLLKFEQNELKIQFQLLDYLSFFKEKEEEENSNKKISIESKKLQNCIIYACTNKGNIFIIDCQNLFKIHHFFQKEHVNQKQNYNPQRTLTEDFQVQIDQAQFEKLKLYKIKRQNNLLNIQQQFKAHQDSIIGIDSTFLGKKCIFSSSLDSYVKFWKIDGLQLVASLKLSHPLPILWNINVEKETLMKKKILYGIKIWKILGEKKDKYFKIIGNFDFLMKKKKKIQIFKKKIQKNNKKMKKFQ